MKRRQVLGLVLVVCVLAAIGARLYYTHHYLPIQSVQPIVQLLEECTRESVEKGTFLVRGLRRMKGTEK
jgi:hypothetical protein